jgi:hypothetical protein
LATAKLRPEKFLQFFARGPFVIVELAIAVLVKFLDHGFPDVLAGIGSTATAFATASTLSRAILGL